MKTIGFCIPIMNRLKDLQSTLRHNLEAIKPYRDCCHIYINCFDQNHAVENWINTYIDKSLIENSLTYTHLPPLKSWHFSHAKNSFRSVLKENYYSSLDGDNFITSNEVSNLLSIINSTDRDYLIHEFTGNWGDGTCGRITIPTRLYRQTGYISNIYPRQFDEVGLILNLICKNRSLIFAYTGQTSLLRLSGNCLKFLERNGLTPMTIKYKSAMSIPPVNPKSTNYKNEDPLLKIFHEFNLNFSLALISTTPQASNQYAKELNELSSRLTADLTKRLLPFTFEYEKLPSKSDQLTLFAVIKDDQLFLADWLRHYRSLGVKRFIIVDDNSEPSLRTYLSDNDIFLFKPLAGNFKFCKAFWIKLLMTTFQVEDSWALTCDSDEFLDIDPRYNNIIDFCSHLSEIGRYFVSAILVDLLPSSSFVSEVDDSQLLSLQDYTLFNINLSPSSYDYRRHKSIAWGFGIFWPYSFRLDTRWKLFNTFDCHRKVPLLKHRISNQLNKGFHALIIDGTPLSSTQLLADPEYILPIRHYKFLTLLSSSRKSTSFEGYHDRTVDNYKHITSISKTQILELIRKKTTPIPYSYAAFKEIFTSTFGFYRIIGNSLSGLHESNQSVNNLRHIINRESSFEANTRKIFILNRITNRYELDQLKSEIRKSGYEYIELDYDEKLYADLNYDLNILPDHKYWLEKRTRWERLSAHAAVRSSKNRYAINNNGARNFALHHGRSRFSITLPADGNCFLPDIHHAEIISQFFAHDVDCVVVPMERVLDNAIVFCDSIANNPQDEPQIAFGSLSSIDFNTDLVYGNQPKLELLKRLGCPGIWDNWTMKYPWKKLEIKVEDNVSYVTAGAVYRLESGNIQSTLDSDIRAHTRIAGICNYLDKLTAYTVMKNLSNPYLACMALQCIQSYCNTLPSFISCNALQMFSDLSTALKEQTHRSFDYALNLSSYLSDLANNNTGEIAAIGLSISSSLLRLVASPFCQQDSLYNEAFARVLSLYENPSESKLDILNLLFAEFSSFLSKQEIASSVLFHLEILHCLRYCTIQQHLLSQSQANLALFFSDLSSVIFNLDIAKNISRHSNQNQPFSFIYRYSSYVPFAKLHDGHIVKTAHQAFADNNLHEALYLYNACSLLYGSKLFIANIRIAESKLRKSLLR